MRVERSECVEDEDQRGAHESIGYRSRCYNSRLEEFARVCLVFTVEGLFCAPPCDERRWRFNYILPSTMTILHHSRGETDNMMHLSSNAGVNCAFGLDSDGERTYTCRILTFWLRTSKFFQLQMRC